MSKEPTNAAPDNPEAAVDVEPDREPDIFDNAEEYVGVDDEAMYGIVPVGYHKKGYPKQEPKKLLRPCK